MTTYNHKSVRLVYVIACAQGPLRIYFTRIFKVVTRSVEGNLENFENTSEINPFKGPVIRAAFFFNLCGNIAALQVETLCWLARITTLITNRSRSKLQCCKSAEFYTYNWSIVCYWLLLSYNSAFR